MPRPLSITFNKPTTWDPRRGVFVIGGPISQAQRQALAAAWRLANSAASFAAEAARLLGAAPGAVAVAIAEALDEGRRLRPDADPLSRASLRRYRRRQGRLYTRAERCDRPGPR